MRVKGIRLVLALALAAAMLPVAASGAGAVGVPENGVILGGDIRLNRLDLAHGQCSWSPRTNYGEANWFGILANTVSAGVEQVHLGDLRICGNLWDDCTRGLGSGTLVQASTTFEFSDLAFTDHVDHRITEDSPYNGAIGFQALMTLDGRYRNRETGETGRAVFWLSTTLNGLVAHTNQEGLCNWRWTQSIDGGYSLIPD